MNSYKPGDVYNRVNSEYTRSRVPVAAMDEIGYDDCDYISLEENAKSWFTKNLPPIRIELHIPCRSAIDHLLSMCNHKGKSFSCESMDNATIDSQIDFCAVELNRFSFKLFKVHNSSVKCFNPIPVEPYVGYMATFLQRKIFESPYAHRDTNMRRDKSNECLLKNIALQDVVNARLHLKYEYFRFCKSCTGTTNDLLIEG